MNIGRTFSFALGFPGTLENVIRLALQLAPVVQNPWGLSWDLLSSRPRICTAVLPGGERFSLRNTEGDLFVLKEVFGKSVYDCILAKFTEDFDQVIDIGANIGAFTISIAQRARAVLAVEPEPGNAAILMRNVQSNGLSSRVTIEQAAVGGTDSSGMLQFGPNSLMNYVVELKENCVNSNKTKIISIDTLFDSHQIGSVDLLKVDCEGAEYDLIYHGSRETLRKVRAMVIELHSMPGRDDEPYKIIDYIRSIGFTVDFNSDESDLDLGYGMGLLVANRF